MYKRLFQRTIILALLVWVGWPTEAHAYVEPGILSTLFQLAYILIFGLIAAWLFRPFRYLKSLLKRDANSKESKDDSNAKQE